MKKISVLFLIFLVMAFIVSGCSKPEDAAEPQAEESVLPDIPAEEAAPVDDAYDTISDAADDVIEEVSDIASAVKDQAGEMAEQAGEAISDAVETATDTVKDAAQDIKEGAKKTIDSLMPPNQ
ncbi:MAG: hypothetical protein GX846_05375 [Deltaproteobacteria bacterium]|nr:hypothetical protein [Deltaproteobacteria bacterium]